MDYNHKDLPEFSLRNSALHPLVSEAAIDIDNHMRGINSDGESVKYLSQLLENIIRGKNPIALLPDNCVVLGYAISGREKFEEYWKGKSIDEVVLQTNLAAKDLRDFKNLPIERQKNLVDFLINLNRESMNHYNIYYS